MKIELKTSLDDELSEKLWSYYDKSFEELNLKSPCMQRAWDHDEFMAGMRDASVYKALLINDDGEVVAVSIWSGNLDLFSWVSQPFYRTHYPEKFEAQTIFYVVATISLQRREGHMSTIMNYMTKLIAAAGGCVIFDLCDELQSIGWQNVIQEVSSQVTPSVVECLGTQTYWMARPRD